MKGNRLIIGLFVVLGLVLVLYFTTTQGKKGIKYQWTETYAAKSDQPYGTLFIQKLLEKYRPGQKFIVRQKGILSEALDTASLKTKTDYVFIGQQIYLTAEDRNALLRFIDAGNDAFISTVVLPFELLDETGIVNCESNVFLSTNERNEANINLVQRQLSAPGGYKYKYRFGATDERYFWNTLSEDFACDSTGYSSLGFIEEEGTNFFRIDHGSGHLYIHTNPIVFTNYFLTDFNKVEYASSVFSYLKGETILWDELSRAEFVGDNNAPNISPVSYILRQDSLRYAWWLMLAAVLLYTLFTARRRQRIIPVLLEKTNSSREFVGMVAELHFQNANHHNIGRKKMKYFYHFVKSKYGLQAHSITENYLQRLESKSKVDMQHLKSIAAVFHHLEVRADFDEDRLATLHTLLEEFYRNCK
jgi:hypothetical protein